MASCQNQRDGEKYDPFGFAAQPCTFPPGTDQKVIKAFDAVDKDCSGTIDECELRTALTKCNHTFTDRTVRFFMCTFSKDATRSRIGPGEFVVLFNSLKRWRDVFCKADKDRDGVIHGNELRTALNSLGFPVSPQAVNLMIATYIREKRSNGVPYDKFIQCCVIVKGLTETFKEQERSPGSATFTYELFMQAALMFTAA
ncbi:probable calcium-binding protein CML49 [Nymphaea colorata]|nr:probable calcium-binding protein CML49 [Nymphaea colorata]